VYVLQFLKTCKNCNFDFVIKRLDCEEKVEDPQILVGHPHIFYRRPHISIGDPIFSLEINKNIGPLPKVWGSPIKYMRVSNENLGVFNERGSRIILQ